MEPLLKELAARGKKAFEARDYARAERCLIAVLREGRQYADLLNILGLIYHHQGKFNNAIDAFREALAVNPDYLEACLNLAILYNDLGEYKEARKLYKHLGRKPSKQRTTIDPILKGKMANWHSEIGDTYRRLGYFKEAIEEYEKALGLAPEFADIRIRLGIALREIGQLIRSRKEFKKALDQKPHLIDASVQMGVTLYLGGKTNEAILEWKKVLKKDPTHPKALLYLSLEGNGATPVKKKKRKK